jgi:hypothetical protein
MTRRSYKALGLLLLMTVVFYWKILLTRQFSILTGFEGVNQSYSWINFWAGSLLRGELPLWDPFVQSGRSFAGEMQTAAFYPPHLLLLLFSRNGMLSPHAYEIWFVFVHFVGACFMYALVREFGLRRLPALVAGICFSFGGFVGNTPEWPHLYESAIWLPVIFLFLLRALCAKTPSRALLCAAYGGLGLGLSVLAGGLHVVIMEALVVLSAAAFATSQQRQGTEIHNAWKRPALVVATVSGVGLCAGAIQLLPSMEYSNLALRWLGAAPAQLASQRIPYAYVSDGLWPHGLFGMLIHSAFGGTLGNGEVISVYLGVFPVLAGIIGVWKSWGEPWVRYLTGLWVAAVLYAFGSYSLLHGVVYAIVPDLWLAREAGRFVFLAEFALAILAAFGLDVLLNKRQSVGDWLPLTRILKTVAVACAFALAIPALYGQLTLSPWIALSLVLILVTFGLFQLILHGHAGLSTRLLIVGFVLFDLSAFTWVMPNKIDEARNGVNQLERLKSLSGVAEYLKSRPGVFRVHLLTDQPMNLGDMYHIGSTRGAGVTMLRDYLPLEANDALLNVGYLIRPASSNEPDALYQDANWKVYANLRTCPRAWLVHSVVVEPSAQRTIERLRAPDFDPRQTALALVPLGVRLDPVPGDAQETASIRTYRQNEITASVYAASAGLLVLSEVYYPGWEATVNGRPVPVHQVDQALRGISVPAGASEVVLRYRPVTVMAGAALSLTAFLGTALTASAAGLRHHIGRGKTQIKDDASEPA